MEKLFARLCEKHGLNSIGVNLFTECNIEKVTVYLHWYDGEQSRCVGSNGDTFDAALERAVAAMNEERQRQSAPPQPAPAPFFLDGEDRSSEAA